MIAGVSSQPKPPRVPVLLPPWRPQASCREDCKGHNLEIVFTCVIYFFAGTLVHNQAGSLSSSPSKLTSTDLNLHIQNQPSSWWRAGKFQLHHQLKLIKSLQRLFKEKFEIFVTLKAPLFSIGAVYFFTQEPRCLSCCSTPPSHHSFTLKTFLQL